MFLSPLQRDFIVQTGDPTGTGRGGESVYRSVITITTVDVLFLFFVTTSWWCFLFCLFSKLYGDQARFFDPEKNPRIKHRKKGTVSMVNNGNNQHGSQVNSTSTCISILVVVDKSAIILFCYISRVVFLQTKLILSNSASCIRRQLSVSAFIYIYIYTVAPFIYPKPFE